MRLEGVDFRPQSTSSTQPEVPGFLDSGRHCRGTLLDLSQLLCHSPGHADYNALRRQTQGVRWMPLKTQTAEEPTLNLTPMIDVVLLLVIFFMVGTQFTEAERQFDIDLPSVAQAQPLTGRPDELVVNITQDGAMYLGKQPVTLAELEQELQAAHERYEDQAVMIRGDAQVPYQAVMDVLGLCQRVNITDVQLANRLREAGAQ